MLIGRDDNSNSVITPGTWFSMFVYICNCFCFTLIGGNLTVDGEPQGNWAIPENIHTIPRTAFRISEGEGGFTIMEF